MAEHHRLARLGKTQTEESKQKISNSLKGRKHSEETRRLMSERKKAYWAEIRAQKQRETEEAPE